ncbi:hypothetical protein [Brevibacillus sp. NRS-1366]|uniref:hypothetical protein n=1 Tax=Brevibacillus sp. NRS-1366 TaxID=3233899 RepID=UPI003D23C6BD
MKDDLIMGRPASKPPEKEISRKVKDQLLYNVLEQEMQSAETAIKQKNDYLKGKA